MVGSQPPTLRGINYTKNMSKVEKQNEKFPGIPLDWDKNDFWMCPRMLDEYWCMLSGSEKGVLVCVLRKIFGWQKKYDYISLSQFRKYTGLSTGGVLAGVRGLEEKGFIRANKANYKTSKYELVMLGDSEEDESKKLTSTKKEPSSPKKEPSSPKKEVSGSKSEQTIDTNNKELKINNNKYIEDIYLYFLKKIHLKARLTEGARKNTAERLEEYSPAEIMTAIDNCSRNEFYMGQNSHLGLAWFCRDEDVMEGYINLTSTLSWGN